MRFYQGAQIVSGYHLIHLGQILLTARPPLLLRVREASEPYLLHRGRPAFRGLEALPPIMAFESELPSRIASKPCTQPSFSFFNDLHDALARC